MAKKVLRKKAKDQVYDNTNRGACWVNQYTTYGTDKETGEQKVVSPELTGFIDVEGVEYDLAAWPVHSSNPKAPAWSFKVTPRKHAEDEETDDFVEGVAKAK